MKTNLKTKKMINKILNWIDKKKSGSEWDLFHLGAAALVFIVLLLKLFSLFV